MMRKDTDLCCHIFISQNIIIKMSEDLISNNFVDNINRTIIKKAFKLSKVVLVLTIIYAIEELWAWYSIIARSINLTDLTFFELYDLRISPVIFILLLMNSVISWSFCVKANRLIHLSFENADADLFNKAYRFFYRSAKLVFASFSIAIITIGIRLFLKQYL
jgi:hypothetical protein